LDREVNQNRFVEFWKDENGDTWEKLTNYQLQNYDSDDSDNDPVDFDDDNDL